LLLQPEMKRPMHARDLQRVLQVRSQSVQLPPLMYPQHTQIKAAALIFLHQGQALFLLGLVIQTLHTLQAEHQWQALMLRVLLLFTWD
jgi:hypothetical protein